MPQKTEGGLQPTHQPFFHNPLIKGRWRGVVHVIIPIADYVVKKMEMLLLSADVERLERKHYDR